MHHPASIDWDSARAALFEIARARLSPAVMTLTVHDAIGYVLGRDVLSPMPVPHYDSSAMDGYAVAGRSPWTLKIPDYPDDSTQNIHKLTVALAAGEATPIFTGGLIPEGCESIVRSEHARLEQQDAATLLFSEHGEPAAGKDIRRAGEELDRGALLARSGTSVTPRLAAALAVGGIDEVDVYEPVGVAVAFSGNEVITSGVPGPGEVRDAFMGAVQPMVSTLGAQVVQSRRLPDETQAFTSWLQTTDAPVLMVTGGSSTSGVDMVRDTLAEIGATYVFESVSVRPGHPALAALLPGNRILLGLPGNPLAAYTSLYSYLPALLDGACQRELRTLPTAPLASDTQAGRGGTALILPCALNSGELTPLEHRKSHMLTAFASADALAVVPASGASAGELVGYIRL